MRLPKISRTQKWIVAVLTLFLVVAIGYLSTPVVSEQLKRIRQQRENAAQVRGIQGAMVLIPATSNFVFPGWNPPSGEFYPSAAYLGWLPTKRFLWLLRSDYQFLDEYQISPAVAKNITTSESGNLTDWGSTIDLTGVITKPAIPIEPSATVDSVRLYSFLSVDWNDNPLSFESRTLLGREPLDPRQALPWPVLPSKSADAIYN